MRAVGTCSLEPEGFLKYLPLNARHTLPSGPQSLSVFLVEVTRQQLRSKWSYVSIV